jgi:hypothetical protein
LCHITATLHSSPSCSPNALWLQHLSSSICSVHDLQSTPVQESCWYQSHQSFKFSHTASCSLRLQFYSLFHIYQVVF